MTERLQGTVLYVDDDEVNRHTFSWLLRKAGFEVKEAATGRDALRLVAEKPDLVVLDVNLPDIDGFEVCRRIKAHPATTAIPVLHLSGVHVRPEDKRHGLTEGADAYLTKPVEPQDLIAQARALLRLRQAEERARAAARQWQATFDALDEVVCLLDRQGRVLRCNRALLRTLGKSPHQVLGRPCHELIGLPPGDEAPALRRMLATRVRQGEEFRRGERWLQAVAEPVLGPDGAVTGAVYILADVTERKGLAEQLRQSRKMEVLGRLAGGVAHDFNNLLTAVTGNVALLLAGAPEQDPDRALLRAVDQAAWRAVELSRQLLRFSRRSPQGLRPTDLRTCLDEVAGILRRTMDPRIALEVRAGPRLWTVQADPGQINQVLMNLCVNARDAMPEGGQLLLEAENARLDPGQALAHADARPGEFVRLRVRDSGVGIPPEVLPRLFEPFFTTKDPGQGTGLGLAVVAGIVRQHQGWVECSGAVNQGTCFDIYLPRDRGNTGVPAPAVPAPVPGGRETLLLVEDEHLLRELARTILEGYGYEVLVAEDGRQAVDTYRREQHRIALVILDLTMPGLSGRDTLGRLLQVNPQARVLLTTGFAAEAAAEPVPEGALGVLPKPYRERDLAAAVRAALDRPHAGQSPGGPVSSPPPSPTKAEAER